jgi:hypothetical protein
MCIRKTLFVALPFTVFFCAAAHAGTPDSAAIRITETDRAYELTVPVSRLIMTIPKGKLTRTEQHPAEAAGNPRYFAFRHQTLNLTVDGWFEPAEKFPGLKPFWEEKTRMMTRANLPAPEEVSFVKVGRWKAIAYVIPDPAIPLISSSISAHWIEAGTWIELELSITTDRADKESGARLVELLKAIQVKEKK